MAEVEGAEAGVDSLEEELGHAGDEVVAGVQQLDQGRGRHHAPWSHTWERCLRRLLAFSHFKVGLENTLTSVSSFQSILIES